jgi:hypothetical protein
LLGTFFLNRKQLFSSSLYFSSHDINQSKAYLKQLIFL